MREARCWRRLSWQSTVPAATLITSSNAAPILLVHLCPTDKSKVAILCRGCDQNGPKHGFCGRVSWHTQIVSRVTSKSSNASMYIPANQPCSWHTVTPMTRSSRVLSDLTLPFYFHLLARTVIVPCAYSTKCGDLAHIVMLEPIIPPNSRFVHDVSTNNSRW